MENRKLKIGSSSGLDKLVSPLRLSTSALHKQFVTALGSAVILASCVDTKPLLLDLKPPLPSRVRVYMYNLTHPPGGRAVEESKIQIIVPGQSPGQKGDFDQSDGRFVLLVGFDPRLAVFVLWDAEIYRGFGYSRNVQVKLDKVCNALAGDIGEQTRLSQGTQELVLTAQAQRLSDAIIKRWNMSIDRAVGVHS